MRVIAGAVMLVAAGLFALAGASARFEGAVYGFASLVIGVIGISYVIADLIPNKNQGKKNANQE